MIRTMFIGSRVLNHLRATISMSIPQPSSAGPVETSIREKITALLNPSILTITNDSWQHRHHTAMRDQGGGNGETHFSVHVVSAAFSGKNMMQRHRMVYGALASELKNGLHALSLQTKSPEESL